MGPYELKELQVGSQSTKMNAQQTQLVVYLFYSLFDSICDYPFLNLESIPSSYSDSPSYPISNQKMLKPIQTTPLSDLIIFNNLLRFQLHPKNITRPESVLDLIDIRCLHQKIGQTRTFLSLLIVSQRPLQRKMFSTITIDQKHCGKFFKTT